MNRWKSYLPAVIRVLLGATFIYAAVPKIADPIAFAADIAAYKLVPYFASYLVAAILPWLELFSGLLLVAGYRVRGGAVVIAFLNLVFLAALASALWRGLSIDCGCFKSQGAKGSLWVPFGRDLVLLAFTLFVLRSESTKQKETAS